MPDYEQTTQQAQGQKLGRYRLVQQVGKGGMGEIWLAEDPSLRRQVAIKMLPTFRQDDQSFIRRFEHEAQAAAALNHPHILPVHDYGKQLLPDGRVFAYFVMPYVSGGSLADRINVYRSKKQLLPPHEALSFLEQAAEAIDFAHERGILHRDIKPSNMLVREDNWLMLADFGIARILNQDHTVSQTRSDIGTPLYMAPEQAQGQVVVASDCYSLAVVAYQLFTGQVPFQAETGYAVTILHMMEPPPPPRQLNPALPRQVESVLLHGLAKDPARRPLSARALVSALQQASTQASYNLPHISVPLPEMVGAPLTPVLSSAGERQNISEADKYTPAPDKNTGLSKPKMQRLPRINRRYFLIGGGVTLLATTAGIGAWALWGRRPPTNPVEPTPEPTVPLITDTYMVLQAHINPVGVLAWSPRSTFLLSSGGRNDNWIHTWDILAIAANPHTSPHSQRYDQRLSTGGELFPAWSPDGEMLAVAHVALTRPVTEEHTPFVVYARDLQAPSENYPEVLSVPGTYTISALAWTADGILLIKADSTSFGDNKPHKLFIWPPHMAQPAASFDVPEGADASSAFIAHHLLVVAPHTNPSRVALGTSDGVRVYDLIRNEGIYELQEFLPLNQHERNQKDTVSSLAWSPDGQYLAALMPNTSLKELILIWDCQNGTIAHILKLTDQISYSDAKPLHIVWNPTPGSTQIAAGGEDGVIYLWDSTQGPYPQEMKKPPVPVEGPITSLAWSPDGQWLAASYSDLYASILVWKM